MEVVQTCGCRSFQSTSTCRSKCPELPDRNLGGPGQRCSRSMRIWSATLFASYLLGLVGTVCGRTAANQTNGRSPSYHVHRHCTPCTDQPTIVDSDLLQPTGVHVTDIAEVDIEFCNLATLRSDQLPRRFSDCSIAKDPGVDSGCHWSINRSHLGFLPSVAHWLPKFFRP